jgi:hypothetical protein
MSCSNPPHRSTSSQSKRFQDESDGDGKNAKVVEGYHPKPRTTLPHQKRHHQDQETGLALGQHPPTTGQDDEVPKKKSKGKPRFKTVQVGNLPNSVISDPDVLAQFFISSIMNAFKSTTRVTLCRINPDPAGSGNSIALVAFPTHLEAKRATSLKRKFLDGKRLSIQPYKDARHPGGAGPPPPTTANYTPVIVESAAAGSSGGGNSEQPTTESIHVNQPPTSVDDANNVPRTFDDCGSTVMSSSGHASDASFVDADMRDDGPDVVWSLVQQEPSSTSFITASPVDTGSRRNSSGSIVPPPPGFLSELDIIKAERDTFRRSLDDLMEKFNRLESDLQADKTVALAEQEARHVQETRALRDEVANLRSDRMILQIKMSQLEAELKGLLLVPNNSTTTGRTMDQQLSWAPTPATSLSLFSSYSSLDMPSLCETVVECGGGSSSVSLHDKDGGELVASVVNNAILS